MENLKEPQKLSVVEFAKLLGVSSSTVSKAITEGRMPQSVKTDASGKRWIDAAIGAQEFNQNKKRGAVNFSNKEGRRQTDTSESSVSEKKLKHYKAELARIEFEEAEGKLVNGEKIKRQAFKVARSVRDAMLNIPDRVSAELAAEKDQFTVHKRLTDEIRIALESLSTEILSDDETENEIIEDFESTEQQGEL